MSRICLTLTEKTLEDCRQVILSEKLQIDLVELRVDYLTRDDQQNINNFTSEVPVILTFRKVVDGGLFDDDEKYRQKILLKGIRSGKFTFVDLEEDLIAPELDRAANEKGVIIIRSFHDFSGVPKGLGQKLMDIKRSENEIPKAAVMINSTKELLEFYKEAMSINSGEKIILGMGDLGFNTRILAQKIGSYLTFTSKEGSSAAPGHVTPTLLNNVYRFREIGQDWDIMGIIGNPVMHTKSPTIHNRGYRELGLNAVYVPFETDDPEIFLQIAELLEIKGFSVTVPFKNDIIPLLNSITARVKTIGACNTVTRISKNWVGDNTDSVGFINPLLKKYGTIKGRKISVIGAGGASKAALFELKKHGAEVLILNRTLERAKILAEQFSVKYASLNSESSKVIEEYSDIIVQTTNVGMHPLEDTHPLAFYSFKGHEFLYDIIYTPDKTLFLKSGIAAGCKVLNGWPMLLEQGYRQFKLFTGYNYPLEQCR